MSLNANHYADGFGVVLYYGERILLYANNVGLTLTENNAEAFKGEKRGKLYLTSHRVIFLNKNVREALQSFSIPYRCMRDVGLEQPVFGANHIKGFLSAERDGQWSGNAKFKLWFYDGGAIEFGQAMMRAGQLAISNQSYSGHTHLPSTVGVISPAPPPAYSFLHDPNYDWLPYSTFPTAPPASEVYVSDAPPPYPGLPSAPMYTPLQSAGLPMAYTDANQAFVSYTARQNDPPPAYSMDYDAQKKHQ